MTVKDVLLSSRELLLSGWIQDAMLILPDGSKGLPFNKDAAAFSLTGSLLQASSCSVQNLNDLAVKSMNLVRDQISEYISISDYNDHPEMELEDILDVIDGAIKNAD